jgi:hypothetical protein
MERHTWRSRGYLWDSYLHQLCTTWCMCPPPRGGAQRYRAGDTDVCWHEDVWRWLWGTAQCQKGKDKKIRSSLWALEPVRIVLREHNFEPIEIGIRFIQAVPMVTMQCGVLAELLRLWYYQHEETRLLMDRGSSECKGETCHLPR